MGSGSVLKFALCEALQFAGLCVPLFIIVQRFAVIVARVKTSAQPPGDGHTAYWLIVASSVAYVTTVALLVWVPMKYMVFMKKKFLLRKKWRPVALVYVVLSTLPCFAVLIASSEVQINNNIQSDTFTELPVSLVLFSLVCIDIVERIPAAPSGPGTEANGTVPGAPGRPGRPFSVSGLSSNSAGSGGVGVYRPQPYGYNGPLRFLCAADARADVFADGFLFWMDTVEMVRVAGLPAVYYSGWVFPIYIFSFLSCLRLVVMPRSVLLSALGVALQDLPFLFVRIGLIAFFGFVTPVLYLMKNLLVCLAFVYFNFMTKLRFLNTERMYF
uniref:Transmembrane protein 236 n=1 Tax=Gadus morhua TaxID=8049 RepID=A0A8C4Z222_GADMO